MFATLRTGEPACHVVTGATATRIFPVGVADVVAIGTALLAS